MAVGRSIWNGSISFGMVVIPIKLYTATDSHDVSFRQVHREDGGRVQFRRFCSVCGVEVPYSEIAKGYEHTTGDIVVLDDGDLANLPLSTVKAMEVTQFVDAAKIDPLLFDKNYYALPGNPAGANAYALLVAAMRQRNVAGLVKVALRQRETMGLVTEKDGGLVLTLLRWPDEVRDNPWATEAGAVGTVNGAQVTQAVSLIDVMTGPFVPGEHTDTYTEAVQELVAKKTAGIALELTDKKSEPAPLDLGDILKASVAAAKARKEAKS
jgi:DNA end-binding protein Ku